MSLGLGIGLGLTDVTTAQIGGTPWTPTLISPNAWFDANNSGSITQLANVVSQWNDVSGNTRHISQGTDIQRPLLTANIFGTKPAIYFATSQALFNFAYTLAQPFEVFTVFRTHSTALPTFSILFDGSGASTGTRALVFLRRTDQTDRSTISNGVTDIPFGTALTVSTSYLMRFVYNAASSEAAVNGNAGTTADTTGGGLSTGFSISSNPGDPNVAANAYVAELLITPTLSVPNRQRMEGYLAWKWGLQGNLPGGHPYKNSAPLV